MKKLQRLKVCLVVTIAAFAAATAYMSYAIFDRQAALHGIARYSIVWTAGQAQLEVHRFIERVTALSVPGSGVDEDEIALRYDILVNRVEVLLAGVMASFIAAEPDQQSLLDDFAAAVAEIEPMVRAIAAEGNVRRVMARMTPLEPRFARFAAGAYQFDARLMTADQHELQRLHLIFSLLAGGLMLCGVVFILLLLVQKRLLKRTHQALEAMADDLRNAKEAAEAASEAKSRFLANMSHELRTPLNAIIGFAEIIAEEVLGKVGQPRYREYAGDILKGGRHMSEIVNDILTMAKLDSGNLEVTLEEFELQRSVAATCTLFKGSELAQGRTIAIADGGDWVKLRADERALRQMLLNLLSNAAKFSDPDTPITISCKRCPGGELWLTVTDRGIGMTEAQARAAVQPFHQVDSRLARRYEGAGLGLSIVKGFMDRHEGRLVIESRPGEGSAISLVFPMRLVERQLVRAA